MAAGLAAEGSRSFGPAVTGEVEALACAARIVNADLDHCSFSGLEYLAEGIAARAANRTDSPDCIHAYRWSFAIPVFAAAWIPRPPGLLGGAPVVTITRL
ncbi:hypothetical protein [Caballeronia ptereochthonis]|uniref:hypothetical protein n=1 Tax=Caballeronia ptereochthonis TaxID=1777144 RepID=UPI000AEEB5BC|nr:hypothetical protein [Caballeronia ptereochthonis]